MKSIKKKTVSALRWSEKYTKTDMVYLAKGGSWLTFGQILSAVLVFLLSIAFANLLDQEAFGQYKFILSIASIVGIASLRGMGTAVTQAVARGFDGSVKNAINTRIQFGLIGAFAGLLTAVYYFLNGNNILAGGIVIAAILLPIYEAYSLYPAVLQGKQLFKSMSIYQTCAKFFNVLVMLLGLFITDSIVILVLIYFLSWTAARVILYIISEQILEDNGKDDPDTRSYGIHLSLIKGMDSLAGNLGNILLFHLLGGVGLAIFTFAIMPVEQIRGFIKSSETLILPKLSVDEKKMPSPKDIYDKTAPFLLITLLIVLVYILASPLLYSLFFPKYASSVLYTQILSSTLPLSFLSIYVVSVLKSKKCVSELHINNIVSILIFFIISIPAIYLYGIMGFVISILISKIITTILQLYLLQKKYNAY